MLESGEHLNLPAKHCDLPWLQARAADHLESNQTPWILLLSAIDDSHAALTQDAQYSEVANSVRRCDFFGDRAHQFASARFQLAGRFIRAQPVL